MKCAVVRDVRLWYLIYVSNAVVFLRRSASTANELDESLGQLRALDMGLRIRVLCGPYTMSHGGIDTQSDYADFVKRYN